VATRGFEFFGNIDGSHQGPVIRDWDLNAIDARIGALLVVDSAGDLSLATGSTTEVTAVLMEDTGGTCDDSEEFKVAIITDKQIWKVSMDAATTDWVQGYTKTGDTANAYSADADDHSNGRMALWDVGVDDDGYVLAYVTFEKPTFGAIG
jgi:hypothetical protein